MLEGTLLKKLVRTKLYKEAHSEAALSIYRKILTDKSLGSIGDQAVEDHAFNMQRCHLSRVKRCRMSGEAKDQCGVYCCNHQNPAEEGQGKREEVILREGRNVPGTGGGKKKDSQLERMEN